IPRNSLILLSGPPGAGKSTLCHQVVLNGLAMDRPVIFVTTEQGPAEIAGVLRERGMGVPPPGALHFVDAFSRTVGVEAPERPDTTHANCMDLNSISIAITRLQERMGETRILLAFDSLTSPYLLSGTEVVRFMQLFLSRLAAKGNSVVALMDEGCGKEEDLGAMMSVADGIIRTEIEDGLRFINVVKHPKVTPTRIRVPMTPALALDARIFDPAALRQFTLAMLRGEETMKRGEIGDYVNLFWPNLARWSGMLWDPKRFPTMTYELNKDDYPAMFRLSKRDKEVFHAIFPWRMRLMLRFVPGNLSRVKDMKKPMHSRARTIMPERVGIIEYVEDASTTDEHYVRVYESADCWGFKDVGTSTAHYLPPLIAGMCKALEGLKGLDRDWNAIETKCVGLGDPYCEFKLVPGEIDELGGSLEKGGFATEKIHDRLMERLMGFLLQGSRLVERPELGSDIHLHPVFHALAFPAIAGERFRMALRMGGAKSGKEVGERLMDAGLTEHEAIERVIGFMNHCKVGKVTLRPGPSTLVGAGSGQALGEAIRISGNCESVWSKYWSTQEVKQSSCFFTTGFLNGIFSAVKNQHVRETKCIAAGDPYCEWEIV
ncbi:MAG: ATPase domain-containing protein, partial [Anaerolineae bacterium]